MENQGFRVMNTRERALIDKLLEPDFPGRNELRAQLQTARVREIDADGSLEFLITAGILADQVKHVVPTEGEYEDSDGVTVHVLLHTTGYKAKELEFYREDSAQVQAWPDPAVVRVFESG